MRVTHTIDSPMHDTSTIATTTDELQPLHNRIVQLEAEIALLRRVQRQPPAQLPSPSFDFLAVQHDTVLALSKTSILTDALNIILRACLHCESIDCGGIYLLDEETGVLNLMVHYGLSAPFIERVRYYPADSPQVQRVQRDTLLYGMYEIVVPVLDNIRLEEGLRVMVSIPVRHEGKTIALLNLASHTHDVLSVEARTFIETLAVHSGGVLQRLRAEEAVRQTTRNLYTLFDAISDFIFVFDDDMCIIEHNAIVEQQLGYSRNELRTMSFLQLHQSHQRLDVTSSIAIMQQNQQHRTHIPLQKRDGSLLHVETRLSKGMWYGQAVSISISRPITEPEMHQPHTNNTNMPIDTRHAELLRTNLLLQTSLENLAQSEKQYRTLVETSPAAILLTDMNDTIQFCNQRAAELFGYHHIDELIGKHYTKWMIPLQHNHTANYSKWAVLQEGTIRNVEYTMQHKNGTRFPCEVSSSVITNVQGLPSSVIIMVRDMSEQKRAEAHANNVCKQLTEMNEHLIQGRNVLRALFDGLEDGLVLVDKYGVVHTINTAMAQLLGSTPTEIIGKKWVDVCRTIAPGFPGDIVYRNMKQANRNGYHQPPQTPPIQAHYCRHDNNTRMLMLKTIMLRNSSHKVEQVILHVVDVTEQYRLQARVLENERFAANGRLVATVAHEINTPLQALQTFLKLVAVNSGEKQTFFLAHAHDEITRVGNIVKQLLDVYRPSATERSAVNIAQLIQRIELLMGKRIRDQRVDIEQQCVNPLPLIVGRVDELTQVFLNLMVNALDAMPDGGMVRLTCRVVTVAHYSAQLPHTILAHHSPTDTMLAIEVADTGSGIAPDIQSRIFEPFVTTKKEGTGLGLSISKEIITQHGGCILLESKPNDGSTFTVLLPIAPLQEQDTCCTV